VKVGILTGGGDVPGLNASIKAVHRDASAWAVSPAGSPKRAASTSRITSVH